jgi:hypothetical protein
VSDTPRLAPLSYAEADEVLSTLADNGAISISLCDRLLAGFREHTMPSNEQSVSLDETALWAAERAYVKTNLLSAAIRAYLTALRAPQTGDNNA